MEALQPVHANRRVIDNLIESGECLKIIIPVRCFTCGKVIGDKWEIFTQRTQQEGEDPKKVLDDLGLTRYCCRRMLLTYINLLHDISKFKRLG